MRRSSRGRLAAGVALAVGLGYAPTAAAGQEGSPVDPPRAERGPAITLDEAIAAALSNNRELEAARLDLVGAEGRVREAWSAVYPTVNASATYTRNLEVPGQFLPAQIFDPTAEPGELTLVRFGNDNTWYGQVRLEQPVFEAGAFIGVGAAARYQSLQLEVVRGRTQEIVSRTKQRYFDVLLAQESVRLSEESVRRVRQALEETQAMNRAGLVSDYDVLRLEVELANLEPALRRAQNQAEAARRTLAVELALEDEVDGLTVAGSLSGAEGTESGLGRFAGDFGVEVGSGTGLAELLELARRNRTELRQTELTEHLRRTELRAEQAEYLPKISFFASYGISAQADGAVNPFGWGAGRSIANPQAGLQVTLPIFNGFRRPARIDQIEATRSQAETQSRLVSAQVENQVETLYEQVEEARLRAQAQEVAVGQAQRGYDIASIQFREGLSSRLELTDAEVALRQSEFNHAQAVHDYLTARTQLDQAVGVIPEAR
ncbi:MAG: TolC family protein [Gemmatimonadota bacterium]